MLKAQARSGAYLENKAVERMHEFSPLGPQIERLGTGAKGKIRLRASARDNNVEGEVAVEVCE